LKAVSTLKNVFSTTTAGLLKTSSTTPPNFRIGLITAMRRAPSTRLLQPPSLDPKLPKSDKTIPRRRPLFLLDNGLIFSLYWTALKSRSGPLRRRAISLLESSSQEGVWIGPIQAAIAKRVIEIEEQRPYEQDLPSYRAMEEGDIVEDARVHSVGTDIDKASRRARVVLLLRGREDWRERIEWVSW
jgi:hypothetical protein